MSITKKRKRMQLDEQPYKEEPPFKFDCLCMYKNIIKRRFLAYLGETDYEWDIVYSTGDYVIGYCAGYYTEDGIILSVIETKYAATKLLNAIKDRFNTKIYYWEGQLLKNKNFWEKNQFLVDRPYSQSDQPLQPLKGYTEPFSHLIYIPAVVGVK